MVERRKSDRVLGLLSNDNLASSSQFAPATYIAYISVCLMIILASFPLSFYSFHVRTMAQLFSTCIVAPATIILSNKKLRKFVMKRFGM